MGMIPTKPEWAECLPYIHVSSDTVHPRGAFPEMTTKISTLSQAGNGVFAFQFIPAGALIMPVCLDSECGMNDAMVDLGDVLSATDSTTMYQAMQQLHVKYYDPVKAANKVNTIMVTDPQGVTMYQARMDITEGDELLRMYGFVTWIFELLPRMNAQTITGFAVFVQQYYRSMADTEVYYDRVRALTLVLENYYRWHGLTLKPDTLVETEGMVLRYCGERILTDIMLLYVSKIAPAPEVNGC